MDFSWPLAVPLLLHNPDSVSMVIDPVDVSHLSQMHGSVTVAGLPVQLPGSSNLLWGGFWWFGSRCSLFLLGCTLSSFPLQNFVLVPYVPLVFTLFCKSGFLLGILNPTDVCLWCLSISIVLSANHSPRSGDGAGEENLVPMGGTTPDLSPVDQTPHVTLT